MLKWNQNNKYNLWYLKTKLVSLVLTSSSINSICGSISKCCILNTSFYVVEIVPTCSCSWLFCVSFSSWPLPLRSYGLFVYTSSSWTIPLLRFCGSSIYTSLSLAAPLSPTLASSSWLDDSILVGLSQIKYKFFFW